MSVTDEAVEAAAKALMEYDDRVARGTEANYMRSARSILESAAPFIEAAAKSDALEEAAKELEPSRLTNAYANTVHKWLRKRAASERSLHD